MISTITVNYKTIDYTLKMVESLFAHHDSAGLEVFVIENASGDSMEELERRFPKVRVIQSKTNLGFAGGCNLAIKETTGDFIVLVNPDIIFDDNALEQLEGKMVTSPDVGIGGVTLKNLDGSQQDCVWTFPEPLDQYFLLLKLNHVFPNLAPFKRWLVRGFDYSQSADVDQVMGALFCIRRELLEEIELLDERFFMWYEEVDYCRRAKDAGWRVRYFADISARHKKGASFDRILTIKKQAMLRCSIRRYMFKHHGSFVGILFLVSEPLFWITGFIASLVKPR
ncbi:glycosyltransferase family 2 protein [Candidatus Uhrbacteria bacterium]|nr:glycosyltransferase family 2 protein [Candidatus Uhrbacteria bacterium]